MTPIENFKIDNNTTEKEEYNKGEKIEEKKFENNAEEEFMEIKKSWRESAKDNFGIEDFDIDIFKRIIFNKEEVSKAFLEGKEWNEIYENIDEFISGYSYEEANNAFEAMQELENVLPGSVKFLHEKFGITNFQRYPKEILINQIKNINNEKNNAILIFAQNDHNGAFDNQQEIWEKIYNERKDTLNFRIIECKSSSELISNFIKIKLETDRKISLVIVSAHSEEDGFYLGEEGDRDNFLSKEKISNLSLKIKDVFLSDAEIIGNACSSGALNGWIKDVSKIIKIKSVGPDRPAGIEDVDFVNGEIIPKYYNDDALSYYYKGFLLTKKRK